MNADRINPNNYAGPCGPLPADFEPSLHEIDMLLAHTALIDGAHAPSDLSQRVFEMSVSSLPSSASTSTTAAPALRLIGGEAGSETLPLSNDRRRRLAGWSRFALAASVLLVAGVTLWTTWPRTPEQPIAGARPEARGGEDAVVKPPVVRTASIDFGDLNRFDAANPSDIDAYENEFSYLLDASEVRSFDDLNNDLRQLVAQLEM